MKKTIIIASLAVLASAATLATFALAGAGKFGNVRVNADEPEPTEYSITFSESNTNVEAVGSNYAIYTTTPRGAKVGVVGSNNFDASSSFTFKGTHFRSLRLFDFDDSVLPERAYEFSHITGFAISFSGGLGVAYESSETNLGGEVITSGEKYDVSITPSDTPQFYAGGSVTVTSLTIFYTC